MPDCGSCGRSLGPAAFSKAQLKKGSARRCRECTDGGAPPQALRDSETLRFQPGQEVEVKISAGSQPGANIDMISVLNCDD
eukprot:1338431-Prymnesium_polylepis.1